MIQFWVGERYFLFLQSIYMGSGANPASYSVGTQAFLVLMGERVVKVARTSTCPLISV